MKNPKMLGEDINKGKREFFKKKKLSKILIYRKI